VVEKSDGTPVQMFDVGHHVRVWTEHFEDYIDGEVVAFDADVLEYNINFNGGESNLGKTGTGFFSDYTETFWVTHQPYSNSAPDDLSAAPYPEPSGVTVGDRFAYGADDTDKLGGSDDPDRFFPT
jgi:hypothetical protein